jgi:hypothetical protein
LVKVRRVKAEEAADAHNEGDELLSGEDEGDEDQEADDRPLEYLAQYMEHRDTEMLHRKRELKRMNRDLVRDYLTAWTRQSGWKR